LQFLKDPDISIPLLFLVGKIIPEKVYMDYYSVTVFTILFALVGQEEVGNNALPIPTQLFLPK